MRRITLALALCAMAAAGCSGGATSTGDGGNRGVAEGTFKVTIQNGQSGNASLVIAGGYVASAGGEINCGGAARQACEFDFPAGAPVVLTAYPDTTVPVTMVLGWAGDCTGLGTTCTLEGPADRYVVIDFGTAADRSYHPNWSVGAVHGAEVAARNFICANCHGAGLGGMGIAPNCGSCHDQPLLDGALAVQAVPTTTKVEQCSNCHASGENAAAARHARTGKVIATAGAVTVNGSNVEFTVNVKVDGVNSDAFTGTPSGRRLAYNAARASATVIAPYERFSLTYGATAADGFTVTAQGNGSGNYLISVVDGGTATSGIAQRYLVTLYGTDLVPGTTNPVLVATAVANRDGTNARDLVGNTACVNCHAEQVFRHREANGEWHHGANPYGVEACTVCHTRYGSVSRSAGGDRLTAYVHGVHNSHEMPARDITVASIDPDGSSGPLAPVTGPFTVTKADGVYARNDSINFAAGSYPPGVPQVSSPWSIGFPGYMVNCSNCHDTQARLDAVMAKPVSTSTCFSCHDNWDGFPTFVNTSSTTDKYDAKVTADANWPTVVADHRAIVLPAAGTATANACATCHNGTSQYTPASGSARAIFGTVGNVHLTRITDRAGLVYLGRDQSIAQGERITLSIDSVDTTTTAGKLIVTWSAKLDGTAVNPCNATVSATAPVFVGATANAATGQVASNMSILQAYAQGNDWTNAGVGTSPGQPPSAPTLTFTGTTATNGYTTCSGNVATSYINAATTTATKGQVALQGKPQITFVDGSFSRVIAVRSPSPVREFLVASGAEPLAAAKRRPIVSTDKCLACHAGSLYQHGGNRIDSVDLCVMCHNVASNEKNNRVGMGVDAAEAYDGKPGQTYDLRYMLHAIHSAGETNALLVYYRTNGIYAFGSQAAIDAIPNWPGAGSFKPYGSGANEPNRNHNEIVVHYPRALNDCNACHVDGWADQFVAGDRAMAVTVHDSGATQAFNEATPVYNGAPNATQTDDVLMGAQAASCMSCHQSGDATVQSGLRNHAYGFGWAPAAIPPLGRDTLINFAVCGAETCP